MKVGIYARLSRDRTGESTSTDRQITACRERMEPGWTEAEVYRDNDISAYSGRTRPGFERMLKDAQDGRIDLVMAYALDRLGRRPKDIERLLDAGIRFVTVRDNLDSKSATSELFIRVLAAVAKMESDNTSARIRLKHDELRGKGMWAGGKIPFGWQPGEAERLRKAARALLRGDTLAKAGRDIGMIDPTVLRNMLLSPRMVGKREMTGPVGMPVILDEDTWQRVRVLLTDPSRRMNWPKRKDGRLLSGLLFCGRCGTKMVGHRHSGKERYVCNHKRGGCGGTTIHEKPVDELVQRLAHDEAWRRYHDTDLRALVEAAKAEDERETSEKLKELEAAKERLNPLMDRYISGALTLEEWERAREPLVKRIGELERSLNNPAPKPDFGLEPLERSLEPTSDPREWLASIIEKVVVHPAKGRGPRFDPSRVEITFAR